MSADGYPDGAQAFLAAFRERHPVADVLHRLAALRDLRVLVIGEAIVDEYAFCVPMSRSPRESIVTHRLLRTERHAGGAVAIASHVAGFCGDVRLISCIGERRSRERFLRRHLPPAVTPTFVVRPGAPTITKRRHVIDTTLVRVLDVSDMDESPLPSSVEDELVAHVQGAVGDRDLVIVADYGHGFLSDRAAAAIADGARFLALTAQTNGANLGFNPVTRWPRADYVCIDEPEARLAARDRWGPLPEVADRIRRHLGALTIAVTRGREGSLVQGADGPPLVVPAFPSTLVDRMGAGDAYLSVTAPAVATGMALDMVGLVGNAVGSLAVGVVGNRSTVTPDALGRHIIALLG